MVSGGNLLSKKLATLVVATAMLWANPNVAAQDTVAQDTATPSADDTAPGTGDSATSITVYDTDYFAPYNPIMADDMLNRVPGTEGLVGFGIGGEERRGLRANTDQILINGKRLTGKESESGEFLNNLPASAVERIEVITGNVREIDADVGVRVINVVLKEDAERGSGVWNLSGFANSFGQVRPLPGFSYSGASNQVSYTISMQVMSFLRSLDVTDVITTETGQSSEIVEEARRRDEEDYTARTTLAYDWNDGRKVQLNGFLTYVPRDNRDTTLTFLPQSADPLGVAQGIVEDINGEDVTWELGADYNHPIGKNARFTGLFIRTNSDTDRTTQNFSRIGENDLFQLGGDAKDEKATETILRGTVFWTLAQAHELELGVEGAVNTLDRDLDFFSIVNGEQIDIPVFNSDQKVTEDRIEAFATHSWKPVTGLEIQTGLAAEFSRLDQIGSDVDEKRSFNFIKPSFDVWYNADESTQIWFSFLRDVGQLAFGDFVATLNRADDEVLAGNPDLVPEKSWDFEIGAERRFSDSAGVINGRIFYRRVNDVKDLIPLGTTNSQPGNLKSGNHYGFEVDSSLRLISFTGVDATLNLTYLWQDSEVTDAFTGLKRRFDKQPKYEFSLGGRHDIKSLGLSYGLERGFNKKGSTIESDFNEFDRKTTDFGMSIFVEKTIRRGMMIRGFLGNILKSKNKRTRTRFVTNQADGRIEQIEFREERRPRAFGMRLRGTF